MPYTVYLLKQRGDADWDEVAGFVVIASNTNKARKLAATQAGDEGSDAWMAATKTTCVAIGEARDGVAMHIVLRDFRAS